MPTRLIYAKDVEVLLSVTKRTAYRKLNRLKRDLNKSKQQYVTGKEFCDYYGLPLEILKQLDFKNNQVKNTI